jgi:hypothetical protein
VAVQHKHELQGGGHVHPHGAVVGANRHHPLPAARVPRTPAHPNLETRTPGPVHPQKQNP